MNLTPLDIQKQTFSRGFKGYHVDEVRAYLHLIAEERAILLAQRSDATNYRSKRRIQPDADAGAAHQRQVALEGEGAAAGGDHRRIAAGGDLAQRLVLELAERRFAQAREDLAHGHRCARLDLGVEVDERPAEGGGEGTAHRRLATAHEPGEEDAHVQGCILGGDGERRVRRASKSWPAGR